jgi:hypothetical protein
MNIPAMLGFMIGGGITLTAYVVAVGAIFPTPIERTRQEIQTSIWKPFTIGLVNLVFFFTVAVLLINTARDTMTGIAAGVVALVGFAILLALTLLTSAGLGGLNKWLGERIGSSQKDLTNDLRSALLLVLACMAPFVGWLVFTPFVLAVSLGAAIQAIFNRKRAGADVAAGETG